MNAKPVHAPKESSSPFSPELLAPAGGMESVRAAVLCGADAVYMGAKSFNARRNAENFDENQFRQAVEYCHLYGVKVYLTLNTLVYDEELPALLEEIQLACQAAVDGVIVQDLGVVRVLEKAAPSLPVHASTQMAIHNLEGARMAAKMGLRRVVLAREMSREEIRRITREVDIQTEVFVHGAHCVCLSGQCYLSSMLGERSGNRGLCAQPCRLPFSVRERGRYGLSLKDLSLVERVEELRELGVTSLKIEGRMKRPEYVAASVTALRTALEGGKPDLDTLRAVFSRSGFTDGYFSGRIGREMYGVRSREDVLSAPPVLRELEELYRRERPLIPISLAFSMEEALPVRLTLSDGLHTVCQEGPVPQPAQSRPTTAQSAASSLFKLGDTPYRVEQQDIRVEEGLFLPVSELNRLRREAVSQLNSLRSRRGPVPCQPEGVETAFPKLLNLKYPSFRARFQTARQLEETARTAPGLFSQLEAILLPIEEIFHLSTVELWKDRLVAELPRVLFDGWDRVEAALVSLKEQGVGRVWCQNLGCVGLAVRLGLIPWGGFALNITNSHALDKYRELGLLDAELSFELSMARARAVGDLLPTGIAAYGYLPMMSLRSCPVQAEIGCKACKQRARLTDRKGVAFPVVCHKHAALMGKPLGDTVELLNASPLYLADKLPLEGFSHLLLYFTIESAQTCAGVLEAYLAGGAAAQAHRPDTITRGLYYRNVL